MKFFIVFALFALVAAKPSPRLNQAQIQEIVDAINRPTTTLPTAAALKQMLLQGLGILRPIHVGPETVDGYEPIHVGPTPVESESFEPIHVGPEIIDIPVPESAINPTPVSSPLVQIIVNVKKPEDFVGGSPVVVEGLDQPESTPVSVVEENPTPVNVIDYNPIVMEPVIVADHPLPLPAEPINIAPEIILS